MPSTVSRILWQISCQGEVPIPAGASIRPSCGYDPAIPLEE